MFVVVVFTSVLYSEGRFGGLSEGSGLTASGRRATQVRPWVGVAAEETGRTETSLISSPTEEQLSSAGALALGIA